MIVAAGSSLPKSSFSKEHSHIASFVAWVSPMYSASHEDRATTVCLLDDQLIAPLPMLNTYPAVDHLVATSPAQSESVYPSNGSRAPWNVSLRLIVRLRSRMILLTALM